MKKIIFAIAIAFASHSLYAQSVIGGGGGTAMGVNSNLSTGGGGGPTLGNNPFDSASPSDIQAFRELILNSQLNSASLIQIDESKVEALTTLNGDYARVDDLKDSFVVFEGVTIREKKLFLETNNTDSEIYSIILENGIERLVNPSILGVGIKIGEKRQR